MYFNKLENIFNTHHVDKHSFITALNKFIAAVKASSIQGTGAEFEANYKEIETEYANFYSIWRRLSHGALANLKNIDGSHFYNIISFLLVAAQPKNFQATFTPEEEAIALNHREMPCTDSLRKVLETINASDKQGKTALYWAQKNNHDDCAALLLALGAISKNDARPTFQ